MADAPVITCPECDKRFRGKEEMEGKKVRCPHCSEPFRVTADLMAFPKGDGKKGDSRDAPKAKGEGKAKAKPEAPPPAAPAAPPPPPPPAPPTKEEEDELDNDGKAYEVKHEEMKARCPNCAKEMMSEKAIVCVYCGYNSLTREIGKTKVTFELSLGEHLVHLFPPVGSLVYAVGLIAAGLYFCLVLPRSARNTWYSFVDAEATRTWIAIIVLFQIFAACYFAVFKLILEPKPKEKEKE